MAVAFLHYANDPVMCLLDFETECERHDPDRARCSSGPVPDAVRAPADKVKQPSQRWAGAVAPVPDHQGGGIPARAGRVHEPEPASAVARRQGTSAAGSVSLTMAGAAWVFGTVSRTRHCCPMAARAAVRASSPSWLARRTHELQVRRPRTAAPKPARNDGLSQFGQTAPLPRRRCTGAHGLPRFPAALDGKHQGPVRPPKPPARSLAAWLAGPSASARLPGHKAL